MTRQLARPSATFGGRSAKRRDRSDGGGKMNSYESLANSIVVQAVKEYRAARKTLSRHPASMKATATIKEVEEFFHSEWFSTLTDADPDLVLNQLRKEAYV